MTEAWHYDFSTGVDATGDVAAGRARIVMKVPVGQTIRTVVLMAGSGTRRWVTFFRRELPGNDIPSQLDGTTGLLAWPEPQATNPQTFAAFLADRL